MPTKPPIDGMLRSSKRKDCKEKVRNYIRVAMHAVNNELRTCWHTRAHWNVLKLSEDNGAKRHGPQNYQGKLDLEQGVQDRGVDLGPRPIEPCP